MFFYRQAVSNCFNLGISMTNNAVVVELTQSPTELYKILKFEGLVSSGAEAKKVIADGLVLVNGEIETRKRKKIIAGDQIQFLDSILAIH